MRRAVRDEQKRERHTAIIAAAWSLYEQQPYEQININQIANLLGLAKGTIYLYFSSKEDLFLHVYEQQLFAWLDQIEAALESHHGAIAPAMVGNLLAQSLHGKADLLRLMAIGHTILEQNAAYDSIVRFKRAMARRLERSGALLAERLLLADPHEGARLLLRAYALVLGLYGLTGAAPLVHKAFAEEPDLHLFAIDFHAELANAFTALIRAARSSG